MSAKNPFFGATFAERKAARLGSEKGTPQAAPAEDASESAPVGATAAEKAVDAESEQVEDKAVARASTKKRPARKKS